MFDISWAKLLVIAVVALIFIGPKELPELLHTLGKTVGKLRRSADDFRRQFEDSMHEAGYKDLHKNLHDFRQLNPANQLKSTIEKVLLADTQPNHTVQPPSPPDQSGVDPIAAADKAEGNDKITETGSMASHTAQLNGVQHPKSLEPSPGNPV